MTKGMTLEQLEKAQALADLIKTVSDSLGYVNIELSKEIFNLANGISDKEESKNIEININSGKWDIQNEELTKYINESLYSVKAIFSGDIDFVKAKVCNCCKCDCK